MGTINGGINILNRAKDRITRFNKLKENPQTTIRTLYEDQDHNVWIGTDKGLYYYNPAQDRIKQYMHDPQNRNSISINGVQCITQDKHKTILGGDFGIDIFNPEKIRIQEAVPKIELTDFQLFNKSIPTGNWNGKEILHNTIPYTKEINLTYKENLISIEFATLYLSSQGEHLYAYKLEGFDPEWNYTRSDQRKVTYMNLAPGN